MQNQQTRLFHPRIINKYLKTANLLKEGEIPLKHKKEIEKWLSNQAEHKKRKELSTREDFLVFFKALLGYKSLNDKKNAKTWDLDSENNNIDFALGKFSIDKQKNKILVPFEFKGADTSNLTRAMGSRKESAVQQASGYAKKTNGTAQWFLVCNCVEFRLYKYPSSEIQYEQWFIEDLINPSIYAHFILLLSKINLLGSKTKAIFNDSQALEKDITAQLYGDYRLLRVNLINGLKKENNHIRRRDTVARAQKLMDRVMFVAFAENRGLLPRKSLYTRIEDNSCDLDALGVSRWDLMKKLFSDINQGNEKSKIFPYNGGLFAPDANVDNLKISDELLLLFKNLYSYDFAEIGTHILGHIFEQSITDLNEIYETLEENELLLSNHKITGTTGKRKQDGIVYTPAFITEYIVKHTLGGYLIDKQAEIKYSEESVEYWLEYRELLAKTRVLDPACGSGAFLIGAFHYLKNEYESVNQQLSQFDYKNDDFFSLDLDKAILNHNLFGVDLNFESVEIAQLALWLETAEKGKKLNALGDNIQQGNSIIAHKNADKNAFNWALRFNKVMKEGGFDVVLGNPPYVRQERLTDIKPYLEKYYPDTFHGVADLYTYFFEVGLKLLKKEGRLGFISSSTFFRTNSGQALRQFLNSHSNIKTIIDFADYQVFEGVTTYPAILLLEKPERARKGAPQSSFDFLTVKSAKQAEHKALIEEMEGDFSQMKQAGLKDEAWQLENEALAALRKKITEDKSTLKEVYGSPYRGVLTGLNEAFVINQAQYETLKLDDPSGEILKPFLEGKDLKRWRAEGRNLYLILFPKGWTHDKLGYEEGSEDLEKLEAWKCIETNYPKIAEYLKPFAVKAGKRTDKGYFWWELRSCAYYEKFENAKITYPDLSQGAKFHLNKNESLFPNTAYFIPYDDKYLLGLLNSKVIWFFLRGISNAMKGGEWRVRLFSQNIERIPVPSSDEKQVIAELAEQCQQQAEKRYELEEIVRRRLIQNFRPDNNEYKLNKKLLNWWQLNDLNELNKEARKAFKLNKSENLKIDLSDFEQQEKIENYLTSRQKSWQDFSNEIKRLEKNINQKVYELFKLNPEDIKLLEKSINSGG